MLQLKRIGWQSGNLLPGTREISIQERLYPSISRTEIIRQQSIFLLKVGQQMAGQFEKLKLLLIAHYRLSTKPEFRINDFSQPLTVSIRV